MSAKPFGGQDPVTGIRIPTRAAGGPTSWAATVAGPRPDGEHCYSHREYNIAVADFALLYTAPPANRPISPPGQLDHDLPEMVFNSTLRRYDPATAAACEARWVKALCDPSDLANAFSSFTHAGQDISIRVAIAANRLAYDTRSIFLDNYLSPDCDAPGAYCSEPPGLRKPGDPGTPILPGREGDDLQVRLIQGAQEENHIFFMNGIKWLAVPGSENSGYRTAQAIRITEHFEFDINIQNPSPQMTTDHLYGTTATDNLWDGQFGLMRVLGSQRDVPNLPPLTTNTGIDTLIAPASSPAAATHRSGTSISRRSVCWTSEKS